MNRGPAPTLRLAIDSAPLLVARVGVSVRAVAIELGFDADAAASIELAVVEAANNAVEHAYQLEPGHVVEVSLYEAEGGLVVEVTDHGKSMPPGTLDRATFPDEVPCLEALEEGGRGLAIVRALMDDVRYESACGRNTLRLLRRLPPEMEEDS